MDSVATSGVVATMTRKPRERCRFSEEAVATDLSGNGKKYDLRSVPFLPRTNALQIRKTIRASLSIAHRPTLVRRVRVCCHRPSGTQPTSPITTAPLAVENPTRARPKIFTSRLAWTAHGDNAVQQLHGSS